jgi:hypothetical protein
MASALCAVLSCCGGALTYLWTKNSGGAATITSPNAVVTTITGLAQGPYIFQLRVTDNGGLFATDTVTVNVNQFVDTQSPTVSITSPTSGQTVSLTQVITVNSSDNVGVDHIDYYRNPTSGNPILLGSGNPSSNFSYSWNTTTVPNGTHSLTAKAYDAAGNSTISAPVSVTVANTVLPAPDSTPPTVSLISPTSGQTLSSVVTVSANATDNIGVTKVDFYRGTTLITTDTTSPWAITWDTSSVSDGTYSLLAKAYDAAGNVGVSSTISVAVLNTIVPPPTGITYATWNPSDKSSKVSLSNGNLTASRNGGVGIVRAKIGKSSGKWYWEVKLNTATDQFVGVANSSANLNRTLGYNASGWSMVMDDGVKFHIGNQGSYGTMGHNGDTVSVLLDMDAKQISFYKNCNALGTAFTGLSGTIFPAWGSQYQNSQGTVNFGATPFTCSVPSGFNSGVYIGTTGGGDNGGGGTGGGNWTTWNPSDKSSKVSLSNGNLTASRNGGVGIVRAKIGKSSGKWYWEVKLNTATDQFVGVANSSANLNRTLGYNASGWSMVMDDGVKFHIGNQGSYGTMGHNGDTVSVLLDMDAKQISFYKNCNALGTAFTGLSGTIFPAWGSQYQNSQGTVNFGATPFTCSVPSGFNSGVY